MTATTEPTTAELAAEIAELRADLLELRQHLATELRTQRIIVDDGVRAVDVTPGRVSVQHRKTEASDSGSYVHLTAGDLASCIVVAQHLDDAGIGDARLRATIFAGCESDPAEVYVQVDRGWIGEVADDSVEIAVHDPAIGGAA